LSQRERTYYQDERAHVTFTRAVIDGKAYEIADITAVRMRVEQPGILRPALIVGFGILLVIVGLLGGLGTVFMVLLALGVISAATGTLMVLLSKVKYVLLLDGADGEVRALASEDKAVVAPIVDAIGSVLMAQEP
jgi:hypothetical protein